MADFERLQTELRLNDAYRTLTRQYISMNADRETSEGLKEAGRADLSARLAALKMDRQAMRYYAEEVAAEANRHNQDNSNTIR